MSPPQLSHSLKKGTGTLFLSIVRVTMTTNCHYRSLLEFVQYNPTFQICPRQTTARGRPWEGKHWGRRHRGKLITATKQANTPSGFPCHLCCNVIVLYRYTHTQCLHMQSTPQAGLFISLLPADIPYANGKHKHTCTCTQTHTFLYCTYMLYTLPRSMMDTLDNLLKGTSSMLECCRIENH